MSFCKEMRKATREIHDISDHLINMKLGIAMTDNAVWAQGLLCFYELFKYLEAALDRLSHTALAELDVPGMRRTAAFEQDLRHFLGERYLAEEYKPAPAVAAYLQYLAQLEENEPHLLAAYIYHLYVGLYSGGQILRKKRLLVARLGLGSADGPGNAVTDFEVPVHQLKKRMVDAMETLARDLGERDRQRLIEESQNVFRMNNRMVRDIEGTGGVVLRKIGRLALVAVPVVVAVYFGVRFWSRR